MNYALSPCEPVPLLYQKRNSRNKYCDFSKLIYRTYFKSDDFAFLNDRLLSSCLLIDLEENATDRLLYISYHYQCGIINRIAIASHLE